MAVKESLMGILTLGPAYGLQLHSELCARAPHRARTNVGQIYATLERLITAGSAVRDGKTIDGYPLYALTKNGSVQANSWLTGETTTSFTDWTELLDHIMIARSLSDSMLELVIGVYESILTNDIAPKRSAIGGAEQMNDLAQRHIKNAGLAWLGDIRRDLSSQQNPETASSKGLPDQAHEGRAGGYRIQQPKRGRPPLG